MKRDNWRPAADLSALKARARLLADCRAFFAEAGVLEVETPAFSLAANTDPALASFSTRYSGPGPAHGAPLWLNTSPEFHMKRLLAAGSGDIYQIARVFRDGEAGRRHNPEFSLLEWYRLGFDHRQLMDEVARLIGHLLGRPLRAERLSYGELFRRFLSIDPHRATVDQLRDCALAQGLNDPGLSDRDGWLDLLLSHCIEPRLAELELLLVYDYPASQAALARVRPGEPPLASRFEVYLHGMELANGFHELSDADEQRARFEADNRARNARGLPELPIDERLLAALQQGLPDCAGVALGLDRLLMLKLGVDHIDRVLAFPLGQS